MDFLNSSILGVRGIPLILKQ